MYADQPEGPDEMCADGPCDQAQRLPKAVIVMMVMTFLPWPMSSWGWRLMATRSVMGARGIGEIGITGTGAAIANAVFNATGKRLRDLPITLDKLL